MHAWKDTKYTLKGKFFVKSWSANSVIVITVESMFANLPTSSTCWLVRTNTLEVLKLMMEFTNDGKTSCSTTLSAMCVAEIITITRLSATWNRYLLCTVDVNSRTVLIQSQMLRRGMNCRTRVLRTNIAVTLKPARCVCTHIICFNGSVMHAWFSTLPSL